MMRSRSEDFSAMKIKPPPDLKRSTTIMESCYPSINERAEPMLARGPSIASSAKPSTIIDAREMQDTSAHSSPETTLTSTSRWNLKLKQSKDALAEVRAAEADKAFLQSSYRRRYSRGLRLLSLRRDSKAAIAEAEDMEPMLTPSEHAAIKRKVTAAERKLTRAMTGYEVPSGSPIFDQMNVEPSEDRGPTDKNGVIESPGPRESHSNDAKDERNILPANLDESPLAELRAQLNLQTTDGPDASDRSLKKKIGRKPLSSMNANALGGIAGAGSQYGKSGLASTTFGHHSKLTSRVTGPISLRAIKKLADQAMVDHVKRSSEQASVLAQNYEDCLEQPIQSSSPAGRGSDKGTDKEPQTPNRTGSLRRKRGAGNLRKDAVSFSQSVTEICTPSTPSNQDDLALARSSGTPRLISHGTAAHKMRLTPSKSPRRVSAGLLYTTPSTSANDLRGDLATLPSQQSRPSSSSKGLGTPSYMAPTRASKLAAREKTPGPKRSASFGTIGTIVRKTSIPSINWPLPQVDKMEIDELQDSPAVVVVKPRFRV